MTQAEILKIKAKRIKQLSLDNKAKIIKQHCQEIKAKRMKQHSQEIEAKRMKQHSLDNKAKRILRVLVAFLFPTSISAPAASNAGEIGTRALCPH